MASYDAVIIGAGHNGLVCGTYLAREGLKVLVLDQREIAGGCVATEETFDGYRFNTGALELSGIFHTPIISELGLGKFGLEFLDVDPLMYAPFPSKKQLLFHKDVQKTADEISKISAKDANTYAKFVENWNQINSLIGNFMMAIPPSLGSLLEISQYAEELTRTLVSSASKVLDETFETDEVKSPMALLGPGAAALPPSQIGTSFFVGWHAGVHQAGFKRPRGGSGELINALVSAFKSFGGDILLGKKVERINVSGQGEATGVTLASGEEHHAKRVISSVDPRQTFLKLLDGDLLDENLRRKARGISTANGICIRIECVLREMPKFSSAESNGTKDVYNGPILICPSLDYLERAYGEYESKRLPKEPALWISIPSVMDKTLMHNSKHTMVIETRYEPYELYKGNWSDLREEAAERTFRIAAEYAPNISSVVEKYRVETPYELGQRLMLPNSDYYHCRMGMDQLFYYRPLPECSGYKTPIKNLYLTGAGTHPGGSVTGIPGYNTANVILGRLKKTSTAKLIPSLMKQVMKRIT